jgi:hypothetical protein
VLAAAVPAAADLAVLRDAGYRSVGFRGSDRSFLMSGALTHVFCKPESLAALAALPPPVALDVAAGTLSRIAAGAAYAAAAAPARVSAQPFALPLAGCDGRVAHALVHRHDLSVWVDAEAFRENYLAAFLAQVFAPHGIVFEV